MKEASIKLGVRGWVVPPASQSIAKRRQRFSAAALTAACAALWLAAFPPPAFGQTASGLIGGVARDSGNGQPLGEAQITVHSLEGGANRTLATETDGTFVCDGLKPGRYEVAASKEGFLKSEKDVNVSAARPVRLEFSLQSASSPKRTAQAANELPLTARERELLGRIDDLEARLAAMEARENGGPAGPAKSAPESKPVAAALNPAVPSAPGPAAVTPPGSTPAPDTAAAAPSAAPAPAIPEALQSPASSSGPDNSTPFAYADFTWLNGTSRNKDTVLDTKFFTPEVRFDTNYIEDFNQPVDHSMGGSTEQFRSNEVQIEQVSVGGDFHWQNVRGRVLYMTGLFSTATPRNDASAGVGQWNLEDAYRYFSEAWGGYHFNVNHGLNVDAGIFVSYIGLFSYYNFDNWTYQPSYVSSNTPWFFNGVRVQWFPTNKLKIEPWFINGWQSVAKYNGHPGLGGQILYRPKEWLSLVFNQYGYGTDNLGNTKEQRIHTDDSVEVRYYNNPENSGISKAAFSFTVDAGCQYGGGVKCTGGPNKESFLGWMFYDRYWWNRDKYAITLGGGMMNNPGRYLTLLPPIDGATAVTGTPYFTENPGDKAHMWDSTINFQWMPREYITWWAEVGYRHSDVPYFTGRDGITPPGGNNGAPQDYTCNTGASANSADLNAAYAACGGPGSVWFPSLRRSQATISAGVMVKF